MIKHNGIAVSIFNNTSENIHLLSNDTMANKAGKFYVEDYLQPGLVYSNYHFTCHYHKHPTF